MKFNGSYSQVKMHDRRIVGWADSGSSLPGQRGRAVLPCTCQDRHVSQASHEMQKSPSVGAERKRERKRRRRRRQQQLHIDPCCVFQEPRRNPQVSPRPSLWALLSLSPSLRARGDGWAERVRQDQWEAAPGGGGRGRSVDGARLESGECVTSRRGREGAWLVCGEGRRRVGQ